MPKQNTSITEQIGRFLQERKLNTPGNKLLLAISGGADSMAMLHALASIAPNLGIELHVAHLDHGIRPEAHLDGEFVESVCQKYGIACTTKSVDVPTAADDSNQSLEEKAREVRYEFFAEVYQKEQATALLTAHHRNDQAETVLLKLCRGCSPGSLAGIAPDSTRADMRILRPLLDVDRKDIISYLQSYGFEWREDPTNRDPSYLRNAVRHEILPALRQHLNPSIEDALIRCAKMATDDEKYLQAITSETISNVLDSDNPKMLHLATYKDTPRPIRMRVLTQWLHKYADVSTEHITYEVICRIDELAMQGTAGKNIQLSDTQTIRNVYDHLLMDECCTERPILQALDLRIPGETQVASLQCNVFVNESTGFKKYKTPQTGELPASCFIRRPSENESLFIRTRQPGDKITMTGASGSRKLQDILTDAKVPAHKRDQIPIIASATQVVWAPGLRVSQDWAVPNTQSPSLHIKILSTP